MLTLTLRGPFYMNIEDRGVHCPQGDYAGCTLVAPLCNLNFLFFYFILRGANLVWTN